ncbi:MAG: alpha-galactosidase [Lachnospiraceae bacterium]|nr:alpha-galactosidase [Lachnospiraceae bacterium]
MPITCFEKEKVFKIDTTHTSYIIGLADKPAYVGHIYYGARVEDPDLSYLLRTAEMPFVPSRNARDKLVFMDTYPMEYPVHGTGDFRGTALRVRTNGGHEVLDLHYKSYAIVKEKAKLKGLPATFGKEAQTLKILMEDTICGVQAELSYSIFSDSDALMRSVRIVNCGKDAVWLEKVLSASFDMDDTGFDLVTLNGAWARERHISRNPINYGFQGISSGRGESSHQHHPFMALAAKGADQTKGEVYGIHFVYSGNFCGSVYKNQFDQLRVTMGIGEENFCWKLEAGEDFQAPEVVLTYSAEGLGGMSRIYHDLYRQHLIRSPYLKKKRPILINNWEATYFDFDEKKLLAIAKEAAKSGIEMLVMDDGWFGSRNDDRSALGDWFVNEKKLKGGLKKLVDGVNALGMKFGIWFEPEMISPDSDLYRAHPDWAIAVPGRRAVMGRDQYVLDLSRKEIRDYVFERVSAILDSANIEYVKWDMNRQLTDLGSYDLPADRQGELSHRYVLAVYELQERLIRRYPKLLLENCSGGGARFDPGMLYYSPQIWCSDDTDAVERLMIQEGTALIYPLSTMGAHVSDCPNHTVGRVTPFETRGYVALAGTFGYELDITKIPEADRAMIPKQVAMYHKYHNLVADGDYYRIASYGENHSYDCYMTVKKDRSEALLTYIQVLAQANVHTKKIRLQGLDPEKRYKIKRFNIATGKEEAYNIKQALYGETLMQAGILIDKTWGDFQGMLLHITEV